MGSDVLSEKTKNETLGPLSFIMRRKMMIPEILLLVFLFGRSSQDRNGKENDILNCGPQNLQLSPSNKSEDMILMTWEDDPSCSAVQNVLTYEFVFFIENQQVHHGKFEVSPDQVGSPHSWNWTSYLALEYVTHSVRISSRYNNQMSPWKLEKTLPRTKDVNKPLIYPKDIAFLFNSTATFYCILPAGQDIKIMQMKDYNNSNTTKITNQKYALTVLLDKLPPHSADVVCQSDEFGVSVYIGYPPDDRDLECETRDLKTVNCSWTVGRRTNLPTRTLVTKYHLNGGECPRNNTRRCIQKIKEDTSMEHWVLTAENPLGTKELTDRADLMKRVHMYAPVRVWASTINARNVTLMWEWEQRYYDSLNVTCETNISSHVKSAFYGVGLHSAVVKDLIPNWTYKVEVRCGTAQHFWKWSDWSSSVTFQTRGDVPDPLDVWMWREEAKTTIIWKTPQAEQSHGDIIQYEVSWMNSTENQDKQKQNVEKRDPDSRCISLNLTQTKEYKVTVTARNINGSSPPSTIITPGNTDVKTFPISGTDGGFNLSWSASPLATCGYIVDWGPISGNCEVEWIKVPKNQTNMRIFSENFGGGKRYFLSVHACTQGAPVLLERREGYTKEKSIKDGLFGSLNWKKPYSYVEIYWNPVSWKNQTAFIYGYVLYCEDNGKIVCNVSTDNPNATSLKAPYLKKNTYKFTVKAKTKVGECGDSSTTVTINSTNDLLEIYLVLLVAIICLLFIITILCYRHWTCIKHKVYPPIPKPLLTDKWLATADNRCHPLRGDQYLHNEPENTVIPELFCKPRAAAKDYGIQENFPYISAQTNQSYYNQTGKKCIQQPVILPTTAIQQPIITPTTAIPPQLGPPDAPFRNLFSNPAYDLQMELEYQPFSLNAMPQEGALLGTSFDGYKPQNQTEMFCTNPTEAPPERRMSCVSTYVQLPH